jgi:hypothetical protein
MYNWTVDERELRKHPERYTIWKLEQMINFGLDGARISGELLRQFWSKLRVDPARRRYLHFLLCGRLDADETADPPA